MCDDRDSLSRYNFIHTHTLVCSALTTVGVNISTMEIQAPLPMKAMSVANKSAAHVQISAEQLLREATDRGSQGGSRPTQQRIVDSEEMGEFRTRKRQEFEDKLRSQRHHMSTWIQFATWEADQKEFRRARSVFERSLDVEYQNTGIWQKYIEMEKKNKFINSCRNLLERVTTILPHETRFWLEYTLIEETLENYSAVRSIFDRWMCVKPEIQAYKAYARFELRCKERERAHEVMKRMLQDKGGTEAIKELIDFELKNGFRKIERARPTDVKVSDVEDKILSTWRSRYKEEIAANPRHYDVWFDYLRLEEANGTSDEIIEAYTEAVSNVPPVNKKQYWRRYIYLWLFFAVYLEVKANDVIKAKEVISQAIDTVPHKELTFKKLWKYAFEFELRNGSLAGARQVLGKALGMGGKMKPSLFLLYGQLELRLGYLDRARTIYAKYVEFHPTDPKSWISCVELEVVAGDVERARYFCEQAVTVEDLTVPEVVWKKYIELELSQEQFDKARQIYERLLILSDHFQVYKAYSDFEFHHCLNMKKAREVVERGLESMKLKGDDASRDAMLKHLLMLEKENGEEDLIEAVWKRQAKMTQTLNSSGQEVSILQFPDDGASEDHSSGMSILQKAKQWKQNKLAAE
eukprot:GHVH01008260.1.p1 GENE.GHVH01008260.1~~GHVH01008260.1.p1  ORF type:complete len:635 (+),score=97.84 GHVH01008260.1:2218-4122(+)